MIASKCVHNQTAICLPLPESDVNTCKYTCLYLLSSDQGLMGLLQSMSLMKCNIITFIVFYI